MAKVSGKRRDGSHNTQCATYRKRLLGGWGYPRGAVICRDPYCLQKIDKLEVNILG